MPINNLCGRCVGGEVENLMTCGSKISQWAYGDEDVIISGDKRTRAEGRPGVDSALKMNDADQVLNFLNIDITQARERLSSSLSLPPNTSSAWFPLLVESKSHTHPAFSTVVRHAQLIYYS